MKKIALMGLILLSFVGAQAKPIPAGDIDKVNNYINSHLEEEGETGSFKIIAGEVSGEAITFLKIEATDDEGADGAQLNASLGLEGNEVKGAAGIKAVLPENDTSMIKRAFDIAEEIIKSINEQGDYNIEFRKTESANGDIKASLKMTPISKEAQSIKVIEASAQWSAGSREFAVDMGAAFNAASDLVSDASASLYQVFNALKDEREPTEDEFGGLARVFEAILESIGQDY